MTRTEHLLVKLAEECAEVAQRATKALRFGLMEVQPGQEKNNAERLIDEYADVMAVMEMLNTEGYVTMGCTRQEYEDLIGERKARIEKYLKYSKEVCGTLEE